MTLLRIASVYGNSELLKLLLAANAKLNIKINDRFGNPVSPEEWFLVPLDVIKEAIQKIIEGTITKYIYDPAVAKMVEIKDDI